MTEMGLPEGSLIRFVSFYIPGAALFYAMSDRRYGKRKTIAIWAAVVLFFFGLTLFPHLVLHGHPAWYVPLGFVLCVTVYLGAFVLTTRGDPRRNLFFALLIANVYLMVTGILFLLSGLFPGDPIRGYAMLRTAALCAAVVYFLRKSPAALYRSVRNIRRGWGFLVAVSALYTLGIVASLLQPLPGGASVFLSPVTETRAVFFSHILLLLCLAASYAVLFRLLLLLNGEIDRKALETSNRLLENELAAEREAVETARRQRHDLRHHIRLLIDRLTANDTSGALAYLAVYEAATEKETPTQWCENKAANALLRPAARRAAACGANVDIRADIPAVLPLAAPETVALFGNLLENACEALEKCEKGHLLFRAERTETLLRVETRNTVQDAPAFDGEYPRSGKAGGGLGIPSMRTVLEAHDGMMRCEAKDGEFVTQILLPLQKP